MRTISIVNQKGGCGKTTTAINAAAAFAELGRRVLLIDLDPQAHATLGSGHDPDSFGRTIYDALLQADGPLDSTIVRTEVAGLDLVPCNVLLGNAEARLANTSGGELLLSRCLCSAHDKYDLCVIDSPPSLGVLTLNALMAATDVIIPVLGQCYGLQGLERLLQSIRTIRDRLQAGSADHIHLLLTFVDERVAFSQQVQQQVRDTFGSLVLRTTIRRNVSLAEAPGAGKPVLVYAPHSRGAADYRALARELLEEQPDKRLGEPAVTMNTRRRVPKRLAAIFDARRGIKAGASRRPFRLGQIEST